LIKNKHFDTNAQQIALQEYRKKSRDNARTPVQWTDAPNGGFTSPKVRPWMSVNDDYVRVNAAAAVEDPNSTYHFWASVLNLRKKHLDLFVYGDWKIVDAPSQEVFAYTRQYEDQKALILCNWTENNATWDALSNGICAVKSVLLNNYERSAEASKRFSGGKYALRPYETFVLLV
jgi:glycosidase